MGSATIKFQGNEGVSNGVNVNYTLCGNLNTIMHSITASIHTHTRCKSHFARNTCDPLCDDDDDNNDNAFSLQVAAAAAAAATRSHACPHAHLLSSYNP